MKNLKHNRIFSIILVAIIFWVNISTPTIANAKNNVVNRYTVKDEHHIYKVQVTDKGKKHIVTAIQTDSNDKIIITTTKKKIKINYCKYIGKNTFGIKKYKHTTKTILKHKTKKRQYLLIKHCLFKLTLLV